MVASSGDELLSFVLVNANRVELEQNLEQLIVQGAVLRLVAFTCRSTLLVFVHAASFVHQLEERYRRLAVTDSDLVRKRMAAQ